MLMTDDSSHVCQLKCFSRRLGLDIQGLISVSLTVRLHRVHGSKFLDPTLPTVLMTQPNQIQQKTAFRDPIPDHPTQKCQLMKMLHLSSN